MAPMQASMSWFLYESRVPDDVARGLGSDGQLCPGAPVNVKCVARSSSDQSAPVAANSSQNNCILLNAISDPSQSPSELNVQIIDNSGASPLHAAVRHHKQTYERNRHWQDSWAAKLPWVESVLGRDGFVMQVRCQIYSEVEG